MSKIEESRILHRLNDGFKIKFKRIKYLEFDEIISILKSLEEDINNIKTV